MVAVFIVQASAAIGMGHLLRCLAFAQALNADGHRAIFLVDETTHALALQRRDWVGELLPHDYNAPVEEQIQQCEQQLNGAVDWLIVDGYQFDSNYWLAWRGRHYPIVLFDDAVHADIDTADVVVNPAAMPCKTTNNYCYGEKFRLLRDEFSNLTPSEVAERPFLTINFGGSDPSLLTLDVVRQWLEQEVTIPLQVITGPAFTGLAKLKTLLATTSLPITHIHNAQNMADIWLNTRIAIAAAGGSQFELCACATPAILVVVADNQQQATQSAVQQGWCSSYDMRDTAANRRSICAQHIIHEALALWHSPEQLKLMQSRALAHFAGNGAQQLVTHLKKLMA
ncbi:UDP-2,4-diacetamido-2,4,6-trideoxy-beta-L-altropyranose hydrolase [Alteromonas sp. ASW11-36]|uniref:UDP-2,4-diacetamido-2,4, 6-trideoxy-beta-L-altropyranose hydrolase n=1 Tax=Alteromonas arenosi TaxID=3055817 RepID=A0ABT7SVW7_9ALTE|nr:UDP-2,4-diacetamido-2,4,6-trideoxy-beta-L-altropyranose hydrolase [Alteromonas sp. ASW11-36]MDM7860149.1 UDP-2,4-diacetamido-2,4,6-trideoxy-beta-L-altropyranose hydrolase [Alteromonas sp. ASW11-36]